MSDKTPLVALLAFIATLVVGYALHVHSCTNLHEATGLATKHIGLTCYVQTPSGWVPESWMRRSGGFDNEGRAMTRGMWLWLARALRDLSTWAYHRTGHCLDYQERCLGYCGKSHPPLNRRRA